MFRKVLKVIEILYRAYKRVGSGSFVVTVKGSANSFSVDATVGDVGVHCIFNAEGELVVGDMELMVRALELGEREVHMGDTLKALPIVLGEIYREYRELLYKILENKKVRRVLIEIGRTYRTMEEIIRMAEKMEAEEEWEEEGK